MKRKSGPYFKATCALAWFLVFGACLVPIVMIWYHGSRQDSPSARSSPYGPSDSRHSRGQTAGMRGGDTMSPEMIVQTLVGLPADDPDVVFEAIVALKGLNDSGVRSAWEHLQKCPPRCDQVPSMVASWLWMKSAKIDPDLKPPQDWNIDPDGIFKQVVSGDGWQNLEDRLKLGESLSVEERSALFSWLIAKEPLYALTLWTQHSTVENNLSELEWFSHLFFVEEALREGILERILAWNEASEFKVSQATVLGHLFREWVYSDPVGVEAWLADSAWAHLKDEVQGMIASLMTVRDPLKAWEWSEGASPSNRLLTRVTSLAEMALKYPDEAEKRINAIKDPSERVELLRAYSQHCSSCNVDRWRSWVESLRTESERDSARCAAFDLWCAMDKEAALQWLASYGGEERARLVSSMVLRNAAKDPEGVVPWIKSIEDPMARLEAAVSAVRGLPMGSGESAKKILEGALGVEIPGVHGQF